MQLQYGRRKGSEKKKNRKGKGHGGKKKRGEERKKNRIIRAHGYYKRA